MYEVCTIIAPYLFFYKRKPEKLRAFSPARHGNNTSHRKRILKKAFPFPDHAFFGFGGLVVCSILVALLGDVPLAIFPVARLFRRRWGMIVMLPLIVLGQIIAIGNSLFGASGFIYFTDGDPHVEEYNASSTFILVVCAMFFSICIAYFVHAAYHDAEETGLMY